MLLTTSVLTCQNNPRNRGTGYRYIGTQRQKVTVEFNFVLLFSGTLSIEGKVLDLEGGRAYVEKDWGSKFPKTWVWIQANHFEAPENSNGAVGTLMLSVASIPFPSDQVGVMAFYLAVVPLVCYQLTLRQAKTLFQLELFRFRGFLGCLNLPGGQGLYRFATYTGAFIDKLDVSQDQGIVPRA